MNKNFNLAKILNNAPKGTKLWSPICGECELVSVRDTNTYPILCKSSEGHDINFTEFGKYYGVLFKTESVFCSLPRRTKTGLLSEYLTNPLSHSKRFL